jgi:hypothetical protein
MVALIASGHESVMMRGHGGILSPHWHPVTRCDLGRLPECQNASTLLACARARARGKILRSGILALCARRNAVDLGILLGILPTGGNLPRSQP